jgi:hypothetical protein
VVRGAPERIDALLAEIWTEAMRPALRWLVSAPVGGAQTYIQYIGSLLGSPPEYLAPGGDLAGQAGHGCELILLWEPGLHLIQQALSTAGEEYPALLVVRRPRSPLSKVLLIVGSEATEDISVHWTVRLARPSGAAVTVLAVALGVDHGTTYLEHGMSALLATDTALGRQMRRVARRLLNWEIGAKLRLREGPLARQIQLEVAAEDYDLIVAAEPESHRLPGDMIGPLLRRADRPVLMTRATKTLTGHGPFEAPRPPGTLKDGNGASDNFR